MNSNHALQIALRSLFLIALTAGAAACGAAPEGQSSVDDNTSIAPIGSEPAPEDTGSDAAAPTSGRSAGPTVTPTFGPVSPVENVAGGGPRPGGVVPRNTPNMPHAQ